MRNLQKKNIKEREANHEQKISTRVVFLGTNKLILFVFLTLMLRFKLFDFLYKHAMIILRNERCMDHVAQFWECIDLCFFTTPFDLDLLFLVYCVLFLHFDLVVYFLSYLALFHIKLIIANVFYVCEIYRKKYKRKGS